MIRSISRVTDTVLEVWRDGFMQKVYFKDLGVRIQLGSHKGPCPSPRRAADDGFVVIHSGGVTPVGLDYCGCASGSSHIIQLLRHRLFPATVGDPKTAATFEVLERFQMLSFTSKISAHDFMMALQRLSDNTGTEVVPVSSFLVF
jgi:CxC2 like cysteine cluster associated with KDZ transposases